MSKVVDERVVEMQFNNQQFEKNAQQSIDTISNLKKSLNFDGVADGVSEINRGIGKISFNPISDGISTVSNKFSALETIAVGALLRIGQKAEDAGERLVRSLSIDQINAGWTKYADKTSSVQTIMAATADQFDDTGKQMEYVNEQLDRLNWFTDETSYNFTDMTSNIGKFTSNGVALDDAASAMQGIATWAAISGSNAGEASRAMYNLSQAMSIGSVKLMDWNSIELAHMGTKEFKEIAIDTAVSMGTLKKAADGTFRTIEKGTEVSAKNFREGLSEGWFTSDVLIKTLDKYGGFSVELSKVSEKTGLTATKLLQAIDDYKAGTLDMSSLMEETGLTAAELEKDLKHLGSSEFELGRKAFKAAQEAKTFSEAIDATKDAVSTGWMNTFEIIFGDYEEAKVLWTALANELYDIFAEPINARNEMLTEWRELGGQKAMLEALKNAWLGLKGVVGTAKQAFERIFPPMTAKRLVEITENFRDLTSRMIIGRETGEKLGDVFRGLFAPFSIAKEAISAVIEVIAELIDIPHVDILDALLPIARWLIDLDDYIKKNDLFKKKLEQFIAFLKTLPGTINSIFTTLTGMSIGESIDKLKGKIKDLYEYLLDHTDEIRSAIGKVIDYISTIPEKIATVFEKVTGMSISQAFIKLGEIIAGTALYIIDNLDTLWAYIQGLIDFIIEIPATISGVFEIITGLSIGDAFDTLSEKASSLLEKLKEVFSGFGDIDTGEAKSFSDKVITFLSPLSSAFQAFRDILSSLWDLISSIIGVISKLVTGFFSSVGGLMDSFAEMDDEEMLASGGAILLFGAGITQFVDKINSIISGTGNVTKEISNIMNTINDVLGETKNVLVSLQSEVKAQTIKTIAEAVAILTGSIISLTLIDPKKLRTALEALTAEFIGLLVMLNAFSVKDNPVSLVNNLASAAISVATAILILSKAVIDLSKVKQEDLILSIGAVVALMVMLTAVARALRTSNLKSLGETIMSGASSLIMFAIAIDILAGATVKLATIKDQDKMLVALAGLASLCLLLGASLKEGYFNNLEKGAAFGLIEMAIAISILASTVKSLSELKLEDMAKGMGAVMTLLAMIAVTTKAISGHKNMAGIGFAIMEIATAFVVMGAALKILSTIPFSSLLKSLLPVGFLLAGIYLFFDEMFLFSKSDMATIGAVTLVMSIALINIALALKILGTMDLASSLIAVGVLAAVLLGFNMLFENSMIMTPGPILAMAAAFLVISASLVVLAGAMALIGAMDIASILKATVVIGAFLVGLLLLGAIVQGAGMGVVASLMAFGVAIMFVGTGLLLLGTGITAFMASLLSLQANLDMFIAAIISFAKSIPKMLTSILESVLDMLNVILDIIIEIAPKIIEAVGTVLLALLEYLADNGYEIANNLLIIIIDVLKAINNNLAPLIDELVTFVLGLLDGLKKHIAPIISAVFDFVLELINGLAEAIQKYTPLVLKALLNLATAVWKGLLDFFGIHSPSTKFAEMALNCIRGLLNGIAEGALWLWNAIWDLITSVINWIGDKVSDFFEKGKEFVSNIADGVYNAWDNLTTAISDLIGDVVDTITGWKDTVLQKGSDIITWIGDGVSDVWDTITDIGADIIEAVVDGLSGLWESAKQAGKDIVNGLIEGVEDLAQDAVDAVEDMGNGIIDGLLGLYGIASPSKVTAEMGRYLDEGLIVGMREYQDRTVKTAEEVGMDTITEMSKAISKASSTIDDNLDAQPTIRPVIDLTDVTNGVNTMNGMFDQSYSLGLAGANAYDANSRLSNYQNGLLVNNKDVVNAITNLGQQVDQLNSAVGNMQVVMDTGALVGSIANPMDQALGQKTLRFARG